MIKFYKSAKNYILISLFFIPLISTSYSQSKDTTSNPLSISGMVDVNFNKNFNNPASHINDYRNFDVYENQFNLSLAKITLQKTASPVGFRVDLGFGQTMDLVNSDASLGGEKSLRNVEDAYLTAVLPVGSGLTINAGKMVTHMGGEVIESISNINYSRSILFAYAIPYYHLGVCANYVFSPQFNATIYLYNGWNNVVENNTDKTLGAEITWSPFSSFTIIQNYIGGPEEAGSTKKRHVFDTIINYQATDDLFLTVNADYGQEALAPSGLAVWKGIALTGKYTLSDVSAIAARVEDYYDQSGFTTGTLQQLNEVTLTYELKFTNSLTTRFEFRRDMSDKNTFEDDSGAYTKNGQVTLLIGSVYTF
ncbi:MAG: porin [Bacteroidetes bacterium]|nr:porin [Bacteroidota bacterium]